MKAIMIGWRTDLRNPAILILHVRFFYEHGPKALCSGSHVLAVTDANYSPFSLSGALRQSNEIAVLPTRVRRKGIVLRRISETNPAPEPRLVRRIYQQPPSDPPPLHVA